MLTSLAGKHRYTTADLQVELQFVCKEEPQGKFYSLQGKNSLQKGLHFLLFLNNFFPPAAFILILFWLLAAVYAFMNWQWEYGMLPNSHYCKCSNCSFKN